LPQITNPNVAQRQLLAGKALVAQPQLGVLAVGGEGRLEWLHSLISQNVRNLQPGQSVEALALDINGHIESILRITDDGQQSWIITERSAAEALLLWLKKMIFRSKVTVTDHLGDYSVVASWGSAINAPVPALTWTDPWLSPAPGGYRYGTQPTEPWAMVLNVFTTTDAASLEADPAIEWAPQSALDALRIAAHRPSVAEVDEKTIPHELDLLASAVHLSKGCYRGQESVAKVHNLGHPPRRLVLLHLDGSNHLLPFVGDEVAIVDAEGQRVVRGRITSTEHHHEAGPLALAVISRNTPAEAELLVLGNHEPISATQELVVPLDAGKIANVPRPGLLGRPRSSR
jgi:tRNA-modifying protein YgfZ